MAPCIRQCSELRINSSDTAASVLPAPPPAQASLAKPAEVGRARSRNRRRQESRPRESSWFQTQAARPPLIQWLRIPGIRRLNSHPADPICPEDREALHRDILLRKKGKLSKMGKTCCEFLSTGCSHTVCDFSLPHCLVGPQDLKERNFSYFLLTRNLCLPTRFCRLLSPVQHVLWG